MTAFDPALLDRLTDEQVMELLEPLWAIEDAERFGKHAAMFPDEGPLARSLYPKHLEFFAAGKKFRERCFMAGNRCSGPWTWVEMPGGSVPIVEAWSATDARVLSWGDGSQCVRPVVDAHLVGIEPAFRLVLDNGRFLDCSRKHRVLTVEGWLSLDQLASRADGLRCWHRGSDYQANCVADGHLHGPAPQTPEGIDPAPLPSAGDAQRHTLSLSLLDAEARLSAHIHACRVSGPLPNWGGLHRYADLFERFAGPASPQPFLRLSESSLALSRSAIALGPTQRGLAASCDPASSGRSSDAERQVRVAASRRTQGMPPLRDGELSREWVFPLHSIDGLQHHADQVAIFYPSSHVPLVGGRSIVAIVPLGFQPIIDAHVPGTNSYLVGGVINHNCGKTVAGAYETVCHLTGDYPEWWEGRRFTHPIRAWAAGKTNETTRDIIQTTLLGEIAFEKNRKMVDGSGMLPRDKISKSSGHLTWKQGVADLVDTVKIRHKSGGLSSLGLKSYQQGRGSFEGTAQHWVWFDEEPPEDVYGEALIRTATTKGAAILTFTPLSGMSDVVMGFLPKEMRPGEE